MAETLQQVKFREHEGIDLNAWVGGPAHGHKVVLLHDSWGCTPSMRELARLLANNNCRVWLPDYFRGDRFTSHRDIEQRLWRTDVTTIIENSIQGAIQMFPGPVHLVGAGYGGVLALRAQSVLKSVASVTSIYGLSWMPENRLLGFSKVNVPVFLIQPRFRVQEIEAAEILKRAPDTSSELILHGDRGFLNEEDISFVQIHQATVAKKVSTWIQSLNV